jgi:hypothetical protein
LHAAIVTCLLSACGAHSARPAQAGDAAGADGEVVCAVVSAAPDVDPWTIRTPGAGFGGIMAVNDLGFTDVYLESPAVGARPANYTSVGVRLNWGGSVVFGV